MAGLGKMSSFLGGSHTSIYISASFESHQRLETLALYLPAKVWAASLSLTSLPEPLLLSPGDPARGVSLLRVHPCWLGWDGDAGGCGLQ